MKQVMQDLREGRTELVEVPAPGLRPGHVLIQTRASLISAGTERMLVEFGRSSLLAKARSQPEKVRQVLDKIKTDGLLPTLEAVFNKLDEPLPLGYCNAGTILEVGPGVTEFKPGDRVASNGPHAQIVAVPWTLCAKIPDSVTDEQAAFTVLASVGLQGIRLLAPALGETVVVFGLGLVGLVTARLLQISGCRVIGVDVNADRLKLAESFGVIGVNVAGGADPVTSATALTAGRGVDGVIITASAKTDEIMHQAAQMCRKRGRIVLVGVVGLNLQRSDFYDKELTFQVSCSYGPGRYDETYEQRGIDYPFGLVRWTEQRNFQAVLSAMANGSLNVDPLISHRFKFEDAAAAYQQITAGASLGVVLQYGPSPNASRVIATAGAAPAAAAPAGQAIVGVIGAGNFARATLMPALRRTAARIEYIADLNSAAAGNLARKFKVAKATSDYRVILDDPAVNAVFVAVGHNLHAKFVVEAVAAGKHVMVEKPLAMNAAEVRQILDSARVHPDKLVMVGFNRRFSPHVLRIRDALAGRTEPLCMSMTVNAGAVPPNHWLQNPELGGGRIIGEGCHFIDLLAFLAGSKVRSVSAAMAGPGVAVQDDKMSIILSFEDGSVGTVNYFANGSKSYPKELLEVFSEGRTARLDNFRRTTGYGFARLRKFKTFRQDKGHAAEFAAFVDRVASGGQPLVPLDVLVNSTLASFAAVTAAREGRTVVLADEYPGLLGGP